LPSFHPLHLAGFLASLPQIPGIPAPSKLISIQHPAPSILLRAPGFSGILWDSLGFAGIRWDSLGCLRVSPGRLCFDKRVVVPNVPLRPESSNIPEVAGHFGISWEGTAFGGERREDGGAEEGF